MGRPLPHHVPGSRGSSAARHFLFGDPHGMGVDVHLRSFPHGVWAGVTMATGSRRSPEYTSTVRGYWRARLTRRQGGAGWGGVGWAV